MISAPLLGYIFFLPTYLLTYLSTCVSTYLPTYLPICLSAYLSVYLPAYLSAYLLTYLPTYLPAYLSTCLPTYLLAYLPTYFPPLLPSFFSVTTSLIDSYFACLFAAFQWIRAFVSTFSIWPSYPYLLTLPFFRKNRLLYSRADRHDTPYCPCACGQYSQWPLPQNKEEASHCPTVYQVESRSFSQLSIHIFFSPFLLTSLISYFC